MRKRALGILGMSVMAGFLLTIGLGCTARAQQVKAERQIKIVEKQAALKKVKNPDPGFKIKLWTDKKDATYKVGDPVVFYFKATKDCRLTLFNVGTSGKVQILFPNKYQKDNLVKAGKVYRIPAKKARWEYKTQGPAGVDLVKAIATLEKVPLVKEEETKPLGPFAEVKKSSDKLARDLIITLKPVDVKKWSEAEKEIKIKP